MNTAFNRPAVRGGTILLLAATTALAFGAPLKVQAIDGGAQSVVMCPDCSAPIACAKAGDTMIALSADLQDPAVLRVVRLRVSVTDPKAATPVAVARVALALTMSRQGHWHEISPPLTLERKANGAYETLTSRLMAGDWRAEVRLTTAKGDTVTQKFAFSL